MTDGIVEFDENMLRPVVRETDLEVHKIADKVWNKGIDLEHIVRDYYLRNGFPDIFEYDDPQAIRKEYHNDDLPKDLTVEDIRSVLDFAESNKDLIESIIEEDKKLRSMMFDDESYQNKFEMKGLVQDTDFEYYQVEFDMDEDGYRISWSQNQTE